MSNQTTENNKRIAKNTIMLYLRMFLTMVVGLYTSRVVLQTLGVEDYGIYGVVGGIVAMMGFLNASMSGATSRFLTFELGRGDKERLANTFSSALITILVSPRSPSGRPAILLDAIGLLPEDVRPPKPVLLQWIGQAMMMERMYARHKERITSLAKLYGQQGIRMLLKGYGCSLCYPKPEHHPMGCICLARRKRLMTWLRSAWA